MEPKKIYIADDEVHICEIIRSFLEKEGFSVRCFGDGASLYEVFQTDPADLLILDITMPGMDGLSLCTLIRRSSAVPILIVSARDSELDRVSGITLGGDDYIVKPFSPLELVARVKAQFRRQAMAAQAGESSPSPELACGNLRIDPRRRYACIGETELSLTPTEFDFLVYLMKNAGRAVGKPELLKELWQYDFDPDTRVTDDLVKRVRKKLAEKHSSAHVETVWGFGYRMSAGDAL